MPLTGRTPSEYKIMVGVGYLTFVTPHIFICSSWLNNIKLTRIRVDLKLKLNPRNPSVENLKEVRLLQKKKLGLKWKE